MSEKLYSSRLLSYTERVDVGGYPKTAFYTEINTNLKPGDRVFILNGNYDSDTFIEQDRYAKYVDGYRILSIDKCRIVLDIDFTGKPSYETDNIDQFIKVWNARSLRDWLYLDGIDIDSYDNRRVSKFEWKLTNNIIFSESNYPSINRIDGSTFSVSATSSFWVKNGNGINKPWVNINVDFNTDTFSGTTGSGYFGIGYNIGSNNRLYIYNEDFVYNGTTFKQRNIYKYEDGKWSIDISYKQPIISKLNFRDGSFKGSHFDGIFGTNIKSLDWMGTYSNWQSGVFVNSNWINGNLNSKSSTGSQSFYSKVDPTTGLPINTSDFSNNKGYGYNYILDSNILTGDISNGNFINCNIGNTFSPTFSAVDDYFDTYFDYKLKTSGGYYNYCDIYDAKLSNSIIFDSKVYNSKVENGRMLNSQFFDSVGDGEFNSNSGIKVTSADIYSYIPNLIVGTTESDVNKIRGVLKLFISDDDLLRLDSFDNFYLSKVNKGYIINSLSDDQKVILPYETKYILDRFYNDEFSQQQFTGAIKNSSDNKYKPFVVATSSFYWTTLQYSGNTQSSIDIDLGYILGHYYQGGATSSSGNISIVGNTPTYSVVDTTRVINTNNVNSLFSGTMLVNADFNSGILENTNWVSGDLINRRSNIILPSNDRLSIGINGDDLDIQISGTVSYFDDFLKVGKNIWLDSIYNDPGVKSNIEVTFGNWTYGATSSEPQGATFSTPLGTFSFIVPIGTTYGVYPSDYINNYVIPTLNLTSMYSHYVFESKSTPSLAILKIESKYVGSSYSITSATCSVGSAITFDNNILGDDYVGQNLSGRYKIKNIQSTGSSNTITVTSTDGVLMGSLSSNVFFFDQDSNPTYVSIHQTLLKNSNISSGLFKRSLIVNSTFFSDIFNNNDRLITPNNINNLRIVKNAFKNNKNVVKSGLVYKSHFFGGTWSNGIIYNSIWKDTTFYDGIFKSGYWKSGTFKNGKFVDSNSITKLDTSEFSKPDEYLNWLDGEFESGEFESSTWRSGTFSNGKFYNSDWYTGNWVNGILGDKNIPYTKTTMANKPIFNPSYGMTHTIWEDGVVNNAIIGGSSSIYWYNGKFNNGLFTSYATGSIPNTPYTIESVWYDGEFNGGEFSGLSKWKNGNFNNGVFDSWYGWENSTSNLASDYGWENGNFNGGQFGNSGYATNSIWYNGIFNDGIFSGRVWNNGVFNKGNFNGGATWSPREYENEFVQSFTNSFYGLWRNGIVIDSKSNIPSDKKTWGIISRAIEPKKLNVDVKFKNALWLNGTFSSTSAVFDTSAWLSGRFSNGRFINSIFNPYVSRTDPAGITASIEMSIADYGGDYIIPDDQYVLWTNASGGYSFTILGTNSFTASVDPISLYTDQVLTSYNESINSSVKADYDIAFTGYSGFVFFTLTAKVNGPDYNFNHLTFSTAGYLQTSYNYVISGTFANAKSFDTSDNCIWNNGEFLSGNFYVSKWNDGIFQNGTMSGAIWKKGTWNYGDANNVYWESGRWRNGNWDGAPFSYRDINSSKANDIMVNVARYAGTSSVFVNNALTGTLGPDLIVNPTLLGNTSSSLTFSRVSAYGTVLWSGWTYSTTYTDGGSPVTDANWFVDLDNTDYLLTGLTPSEFYDRTGTVPLLFKTTGGVFGTTSIFTQSNVYYKIEIDVRVESDTNGGAFVEVWTGPKLTYQSYHDGVDPDTLNDPTYSTINLGWQPSLADINNPYLPFYESIWGNGYLNKFTPLSTTLRLRARSPYDKSNKCRVRILRVSVKPISNIDYSPYNNKTVLPWVNTTPSFGDEFSLSPYSLISSIVVDNSIASLKYGNGYFKSGIWENGVWNNGNRMDSTKREFRFISASPYIVSDPDKVYTVYSNKWTINLETKDDSQIQGLSVGDTVSIGNISGYDYNDVRKPIKSLYTISKITSGLTYSGTTQSQSRVEFTLQSNYRLRYITIDSPNHLVYVSKNIWKSGIFLNGYFSGVWNYGMVKGYPMLTKIEDTHMIDGIFDGGHFAGATGTYVNYSNSVNSGNLKLPYNKSLIQNFIFRDNNIATSNEFKFQSWIDLNYTPGKMVNLYSDVNYYDETFEFERPLMNWNGYPTVDVLQSTSTIRDVSGTQSKVYKLGSKYNIYNNFIRPTEVSYNILGHNYKTLSGSQFNKPFDNTVKYKIVKSGTSTVLATYSLPGMNNFYIDGWTISTYDYVFVTHSGGTVSVSTDIPSQYFYASNILGTQSAVNSSLVVKGPTSVAKNINILNNEQVKLENDRYSIIDFDIDYYQGNPTYSETIFNVSGYTTITIWGITFKIPIFVFEIVSYPSLYFFNKPNSFSPNKNLIINHLTTPNKNKIEYYYNRTSLNMSFWSIKDGSNPFSTFGTASFSKIKMYEVDMIPFFQYFTQSNIDKTIKSPYKATSTFIDYTNPYAHDSVDTTSITIERVPSNTPQQQFEYDYIYSPISLSGPLTVICTELNRQGYLMGDILAADEEFGKIIRETQPEVMMGYHIWAAPIVSQMKKSKSFTKLVWMFAKPWATQMAYEMGAVKKGSIFGKILMKFGIWMSRKVWEFKSKKYPNLSQNHL